MLPVRQLRGDWWELNEEGTILERQPSGAAIRIGDRVRVQVERGRRRRAGGSTCCPSSCKARRPMAKGKQAQDRRRRRREQPHGVDRFELLDKSSAGSCCTGTEVKSLRDGGAQLKDGYATVRDGELWLHNVHIPPYAPGLARQPRARARPQAAAPPPRDRAADGPERESAA